MKTPDRKKKRDPPESYDDRANDVLVEAWQTGDQLAANTLACQLVFEFVPKVCGRRFEQSPELFNCKIEQLKAFKEEVVSEAFTGLWQRMLCEGTKKKPIDCRDAVTGRPSYKCLANFACKVVWNKEKDVVQRWFGGRAKAISQLPRAELSSLETTCDPSPSALEIVAVQDLLRFVKENREDFARIVREFEKLKGGELCKREIQALRRLARRP